ncbi:MAG: energy transducer TonB, partial [Acidobacteriota bacterium]
VVRVEPSPSCLPTIVGLVPKSAAPPKASASLVSHQKRFRSAVTAMTDWGERLEVSKNQISLRNVECGEDRFLLLSLQMDPSTQVVIVNRDEGTVYLQVGQGSLVENGVVRSTSLTSQSQLMMEAIRPAMVDLEPHKGPDGVYRITGKRFMSQVETIVEAQAPAGKRVPGFIAMVKVRVNKEGNLVLVSPVRGESDFFPGILTALRQWKFKPFQVDGEPVEIECMLAYIQDQDGSIKILGR